MGPARGLVGVAGVDRARDIASVRYYHVMLESHAVVIANGLQCESFYPGATSMSVIPPMEQLRLRRLWPNVALDPVGAYGDMVLPTLSRVEMQVLASHGHLSVPGFDSDGHANRPPKSA